MSKKFFTLIHGEGIHVAPKTKIIPAAEFSTLLSAEEVLTTVHTDVEKYKIEVVAECEKLKEEAQAEGFKEGFGKWMGQIAQLEAEVKRVHQDLERMIIPIALKTAKKIVGKEIELSETTIVDIVASNLKAVSQHKKITIYVNKKDLEIVEAHRTRLRQIFENLEVLSIRERSDIKLGGCVIETEGGIINAQLENQWHVIENAFEAIMRAREKQNR